ncbi:hypothetical protein AB4114_11030 [Paenibacillus sp. 2RAB27]|uniref:hypothetical protein n=1 Tax=Paenibacillus sp. 2RAB27 TaxID=3232991 RepID=UPI003F9B1770
MFAGFARVLSPIDNTSDLSKRLKELAGKQVYVGVPEGSENNRPTVSGDITNAELLYIHTHGVRRKAMRDEMNPKVEAGMKYSKAYQMYLQTHGSPLWHSPPRPVIEPAIQYNKDIIAKQLRKVLEAVLNGQNPDQELHKVGLLGQNVVRDWFTNPSNGWAANAESTVQMKGSDRPLINQGELRKSITYVIKEGE